MQVNKIFNRQLSKAITINQEYGINVKPAAFFTKLTDFSDKDVFIARQGEAPVNVKSSLIKLLHLELLKGDKVQLIADKKYPKKLFQALANCLEAPTDKGSFHAYNDYSNSF